MIERRIEEFVREAISGCRENGDLVFEGDVQFEISVPREEKHGDFSTNAALVLARRVGKKPREVAQTIADRLASGVSEIDRVEVAGPGFINFFMKPRIYLEGLREISDLGAAFGETNAGRGKRLQVEFVSANPTGPLHIGHGRGAVYGDVLGNVLKAAGYDVSKEYYVNDAGNQIRTLGRSVLLRMRQQAGEDVKFPDECYQGGYVSGIASDAAGSHGPELSAMSEEEAIAFLGELAGERILSEIRRDLAETGVVHDAYFFESRLHTDSAVESAIGKLVERGHVFEEGGAQWFRSTSFGDDKDRVMRKADGSLTYFASDIAYHKNKYERGFSRVIDIWGADHGGYVGRMKAAIAALGYDPGSFDAVLIQLVNLVRGGEAVSMSTRSATYETLEDVRNEVGRDACRYFFLMRSHNAQLDFDLDLAKKHSADNPVYYIQYAHARIASIFRKAAEAGMVPPGPKEVDLGLLDLPEEPKLARLLCELPSVVSNCAEELEPHKLAFYLLEVARMFQAYYSRGRKDDRYRVISDDRRRCEAKLFLLKNVQIVLQNALRILGISAPERMEREIEESNV
ncbi:MAG TPA: arginine--tRNA ligase [bacterium]|nr:arginine--tRNA ligase [bacterium]